MACFFCIFLPTVLILVVIRKYRESKWGECTNKEKLNGKVAIVTGANSGIGFETAKELALRGADVIFACRSFKNATEAINKIRKSAAVKSELFPMVLDLASVKSIQEFAKEIKDKFPNIHILINNAGVSLPKDIRKETEDGFEYHFGINHLGHFLLTNLLLDILKKSKPSRIIVVSSLLHEKSALYINDLNMKNTKDKINLYASSKLANIYFVRELAKKIRGSGISVYAVCPGWVYTGLFRYHNIKWYHYIAVAPIAFFFMRNAQQGAQTLIYCVTEPSLSDESGYLYRNCEKYTSKHNFDENIGARLWEESEKMLKACGAM